MKDWVIPLLRQIRPEMISEQSYEAEIQQVPFCWRRVANLFLHEFGSDSMTELLGSVLCDLFKSDFDKIVAVYPFFILARGAGFCQKLHRASGDLNMVIFVASELAPMNWSARRGCVAHELGHVVLGHLNSSFSLDDPYREKQQAEADNLVRAWGLGYEIDSVRKYLSERRK